MTTFELTHDDIFAQMRQIIVKQFDLASAAIEPTTSFTELGIDSIERVDLTLQLEKHFGIQLPNQQVKTCQTIAELVNLVQMTREKQAEEFHSALRRK